jgi:hypothetical protein
MRTLAEVNDASERADGLDAREEEEEEEEDGERKQASGRRKSCETLNNSVSAGAGCQGLTEAGRCSTRRISGGW